MPTSLDTATDSPPNKKNFMIGQHSNSSNLGAILSTLIHRRSKVHYISTKGNLFTISFPPHFCNKRDMKANMQTK